MNRGTCQQCLAADRSLYPVTRYLATVGHWRPISVCFSCLGPAYLDKDDVPITIQESQEYRGLPRKNGPQREEAA